MIAVYRDASLAPTIDPLFPQLSCVTADWDLLTRTRRARCAVVALDGEPLPDQEPAPRGLGLRGYPPLVLVLPITSSTLDLLARVNAVSCVSIDEVASRLDSAIRGVLMESQRHVAASAVGSHPTLSSNAWFRRCSKRAKRSGIREQWQRVSESRHRDCVATGTGRCQRVRSRSIGSYAGVG